MQTRIHKRNINSAKQLFNRFGYGDSRLLDLLVDINQDYVFGSITNSGKVGLFWHKRNKQMVSSSKFWKFICYRPKLGYLIKSNDLIGIGIPIKNRKNRKYTILMHNGNFTYCNNLPYNRSEIKVLTDVNYFTGKYNSLLH